MTRLNWRAELKAAELAEVDVYEEALAELRAAERKAMATLPAFERAREHATARAKTRLAKSAAATPGCAEPLKGRKG